MSDSGLIHFKRAFDAETEPSHELLCCSECEVFLAIPVDDATQPKCPRCENFGKWVGEDDEAVARWCERANCSMHLKFTENHTCVGIFNDRECKRETVVVDGSTAWNKAVIQEDAGGTITGLANLLEKIKQANGWETSHHKDKGGSHSSSAAATHAKGDQQNASQKRNFIRFINEAMEAVQRALDEDEQIPIEVKRAFEKAEAAINRLETM